MGRVIIIIPAYNEEKSIGRLLRSLDFSSQDIVVVDDGSTDRTSQISQSCGVYTIRHNHNMGKGMAHRTAFRFACNEGAEWVITMDADGQHSPDDIPRFLKSIKEDKGDMIIGVRNISLTSMPLARLQTNLWTSFVVSLLAGTRVKDSQSGFRALRREIITTIPLSSSNFQTESEIIVKAARRGFRISSVSIKTIYNESKSAIKPVLDTIRFIKLVLRSIWL